MKPYRTIATDCTIELEIKKSRFICQLRRLTTEEEARNWIAHIKKEHYKARHNCSSFILGESGQIKRSSDDGEPSGTAGVPMLTVLENHQLTNVCAVVTRYFGGIKLGAGGLIRAYGQAVADALAASQIVTVKEQSSLTILMSYRQYQEFPNWLKEHDLVENQPSFTDQVETTIFADEADLPHLSQSLMDFFHGKISFQEGDKRIVEVSTSI